MTLPHLPLSSELAVALAVAATDDQPGVVVLLFDDQGVLLAVRVMEGYIAATVTESCRRLLDLLSATETLGPAVVVAVHPEFGPDHADAERPRLQGCFEDFGCPLVDWLLVTKDGGAVSLNAD